MLGGRLLKRWRYIGVYGPELMLCAGVARVGPTLQGFWAVWDRESRRLLERTRPGRGGVRFERGRAQVRARGLELDLAWEEEPGVEVVTPDGGGYAWTRKQGGVSVRGSFRDGGVVRPVAGRGVIDDSAGYHARRTAWRWSAGVGTAHDGRAVAWNLVSGVHDDPRASERTVWVEGEPHEVGEARFAEDLSEVAVSPVDAEGGLLLFSPEATRERHDNLLLLRSDYVQPFGTFSGSLPGTGELAEGYGVMERHEVVW